MTNITDLAKALSALNHVAEGEGAHEAIIEQLEEQAKDALRRAVSEVTGTPGIH